MTIINKEKNKIILINPPLFYSSDGAPHSLDVSVPPLGLLYLATYINKNSDRWEASIIDIGPEKQKLEDTIHIISKEQPLVVGITGMTPQLQGVVELAKKIKSLPNIIVAVGGPHVSGDPDFVNRFSDIIDFAIAGEAETTLFNLLENISNGVEINGLYQGEPLKNLEELPILNKNLIDRSKYAKHESMTVSRGCPFNCYYCSRPAVNKLIRYRNPKSVIEEIEQMYEYCGGIVHFQDDTITAKREEAVKLCHAFINSGLKIRWQCNTRIDLIDEELISLMSQAGCELINFGIESGNDKLRKEIIHKPFNNEDIKKKIYLCKKYNIKAAAYFMLGHPTETKETLEETKNLVLNGGFYMVGISIPTPFPGSLLYGVAEEAGIINKGILDDFALKKMGEGYAGNYPLYIPQGFTVEDLLAARKNTLRKFYLKPRFILRRILEDMSSWKNFKRDAVDAISLVVSGASSRQPYKEKKDNKVVIVSPFFPPNIGGLETHLKQLTNYLREMDISTTVLTYKPLTVKTDYKKTEKDGSVEVKRFWWFGHNWFEKFAKIPLIEFIYIIPGLLIGVLFYSLKNRKKITCFHAHGLAAGFIVRITTLFVKKRKILSTHYIYNLKSESIFTKVLVWVFKDFDFIMPVGEESLNELAAVGLKKEKMKAFKQWVNNKSLFVYDKNKTGLRSKLSFPRNKTIVLFVGRLLEMKGITKLIDAAKKDKNIVFIFVGSGPMEQELKKSAKEHSNIIYAGSKYGEELVQFYNVSDMVALPSVEEGSSLVVVEGLSCGKPIIVTNKGCSKDMFPDELGEKIEPSAENILTAVLKIKDKLKNNPKLEQECREFALKNYSDNNAREILNEYKICN